MNEVDVFCFNSISTVLVLKNNKKGVESNKKKHHATVFYISEYGVFRISKNKKRFSGRQRAIIRLDEAERMIQPIMAHATTPPSHLVIQYTTSCIIVPS